MALSWVSFLLPIRRCKTPWELWCLRQCLTLHCQALPWMTSMKPQIEPFLQLACQQSFAEFAVSYPCQLVSSFQFPPPPPKSPSWASVENLAWNHIFPVFSEVWRIRNIWLRSPLMFCNHSITMGTKTESSLPKATQGTSSKGKIQTVGCVILLCYTGLLDFQWLSLSEPSCLKANSWRCRGLNPET